MNQPRVSVLIPTYNRAHFLPEALKSVLRQTLAPSQVIVINDGCTDNTCEVLAPYRDRIEYLKHEKNQGKSAALNLGMTRVTGEYVWIMDDDDVAFPDALERHLRVLGEHPELGFTYSSWVYADTGPDGRLRPLEEVRFEEVPDEGLFLRLAERSFLTHPCLVVRTSCYRAVGPFNAKRVRSEDSAMVLKLLHRYPATRIPGPTYYYRRHPGVRGTAACPISPEGMHVWWRHETQNIGRELRQELELHEYLPRAEPRKPLGPAERRRAYLQRMVIMAARGLYAEMQEDIRLVCSEEAVGPLTERERERCRRAVRYIPPRPDPFFRASLMREVSACADGVIGRQMRVEFLAVLYLRGTDAWVIKRDYGEARRCYWAALWLGGRQCFPATFRRFCHAGWNWVRLRLRLRSRLRGWAERE